MKLHCGDMVEGALRDALKGDQSGATETTKSPAMTTGTTETPSSGT